MSAQKVDAVCSVEGCGRVVKARGLCPRCYQRGLNAGEFTDLRQKASCRADLADDVDDAVVQRLVDGERLPHSSFERREAVARLHRRGLGHRRISKLMGIDRQQVFRDLSRYGLVQHRDSA